MCPERWEVGRFVKFQEHFIIKVRAAAKCSIRGQFTDFVSRTQHWAHGLLAHNFLQNTHKFGPLFAIQEHGGGFLVSFRCLNHKQTENKSRIFLVCRPSRSSRLCGGHCYQSLSYLIKEIDLLAEQKLAEIAFPPPPRTQVGEWEWEACDLCVSAWRIGARVSAVSVPRKDVWILAASLPKWDTRNRSWRPRIKDMGYCKLERQCESGAVFMHA